jgi:hypothetical protein
VVLGFIGKQEHVNQVDDVCVSGGGLDPMLSTQQTTEYWYVFEWNFSLQRVRKIPVNSVLNYFAAYIAGIVWTKTRERLYLETCRLPFVIWRTKITADTIIQ